jgi:hypothetical protein
MIRGLFTHARVLYSIEGDKLYSIDSGNAKTERGTINSVAGVVDFESNLTQLVINDGSYLYVYTPSLGTLVEATNYPGGDRISFLDQRINFLYRGTQKFGWTALGNAASIDTLAFASAESSPDILVSQVAFNQDLVLLGEYSTEIFDTRATESVYSRTTAAIDYGCIAPHSAQKTANSLLWLGREKNGQAQVLRMRGHQVVPVSNAALEEGLEGLELVGSRAFTYQQGKQAFYCLNVPGLETTWVYDDTYGQWHERGEWDGEWSKWRPTCHAFAYGKHYLGCGNDLCILDPDVHTYAGRVKRRVRIAPVLSAPSRKRVFIPSFEAVCQKGTGAQLMLRISDDNGYNWSNWSYATLGRSGQFSGQARFNRLGSAFDPVVELVITDDVPLNLVQVNLPLS